ncbi:hypothetical protein DIPPA_06413 [Diplonema papillatum]|nr:hypothetical protein DIPPA_06413 [Diplonema papillatum]|eukprot:gene13553-20873_t
MSLHYHDRRSPYPAVLKPPLNSVKVTGLLGYNRSPERAQASAERCGCEEESTTCSCSSEASCSTCSRTALCSCGASSAGSACCVCSPPQGSSVSSDASPSGSSSSGSRSHGNALEPKRPQREHLVRRSGTAQRAADRKQPSLHTRPWRRPVAGLDIIRRYQPSMSTPSGFTSSSGTSYDTPSALQASDSGHSTAYSVQHTLPPPAQSVPSSSRRSSIAHPDVQSNEAAHGGLASLFLLDASLPSSSGDTQPPPPCQPASGSPSAQSTPTEPAPRTPQTGGGSAFVEEHGQPLAASPPGRGSAFTVIHPDKRPEQPQQTLPFALAGDSQQPSGEANIPQQTHAFALAGQSQQPPVEADPPQQTPPFASAGQSQQSLEADQPAIIREDRPSECDKQQPDDADPLADPLAPALWAAEEEAKQLKQRLALAEGRATLGEARALSFENARNRAATERDAYSERLQLERLFHATCSALALQRMELAAMDAADVRTVSASLRERLQHSESAVANARCEIDEMSEEIALLRQRAQETDNLRGRLGSVEARLFTVQEAYETESAVHAAKEAAFKERLRRLALVQQEDRAQSDAALRKPRVDPAETVEQRFARVHREIDGMRDTIPPHPLLLNGT